MFQCDFLSLVQQISVKYHENISAKMFITCMDTCLEMLFTFQQDSAPAHHAHKTIWLLQCETPRFHSAQPDLWPPKSSDLNPVDYMVWEVMEQCVYQSSVNPVNELKECLIAVWSDFRQDIIDTAIDHWRNRLQACVCENGGHFLNIFCEQTLANNLHFCMCFWFK